MKQSYPYSIYDLHRPRRFNRAKARVRRGAKAKSHRSVFVDQGNRFITVDRRNRLRAALGFGPQTEAEIFQ